MGESGRSIYERAGEHWADRQKLSEDSHMVKHWADSHGELQEPPQFKFKVVASFKDALTRQVSEAVRIELRGGGVLNSKSEYSRCRIPRLTIDQEEWKNMKKAERKEIEPPAQAPIQNEEIDEEQDESTIEGAGCDDRKRKENITESSKSKRRKLEDGPSWGEKSRDRVCVQDVRSWLKSIPNEGGGSD